MPRPPAAAVAVAVLGLAALAGCARNSGSSGTTLQPLVTPGPAVESTVETTTTVVAVDPAAPLLSVLPEAACALAPPEPGGEITFVTGDRLFGVLPDGTGGRCLATIAPAVRGAVSWSPDATRAVVGAASVLDAGGTRSSGFNPANVRVQWEFPAGQGLIGPSDTNNTLIRRDMGPVNVRTEITFLAKTLFAVSHPTGQALIASGIDPSGVAGVFLADPAGRGRQPLLTAGAGTQITEIAADAEGDDVYLVSETAGGYAVHRLHLSDLTVLELSTEPAPAGRLTVGPPGGTAAWRVGLCNSVTELRVRDDRSGSTRPIGEATPFQGLSVAPVGWLDAARLVLTARPIGCDGPADVWIWNLLDGSAALVTKNVEFVAVRIPFAGGAGLELNPAAQPAQL